MKFISGISEINNCYDAFLIDSWGVLQDGTRKFPKVEKCLKTLLENKKKVIIVSNAARRRQGIQGELEKVGIPNSLYTDIVSSGEMTWLAMHTGTISNIVGTTGYYLGPNRSKSLCEGLDCLWTETPEQADFILNTGAPNGNPVSADHLEPLLTLFSHLDLPMICANPDQVAIRGGNLGISAGSIAKLYEKLKGGPITYFGKPETDIFRTSLGLLPEIKKSRIVMIGDGLETDIAGAQNFEIDSVFITSGIHSSELNILDQNSIRQCVRNYKTSPAFVCETFNW